MADVRFYIPTNCFIGPDVAYKLPLVLEGMPNRALLMVDPNLPEAKTKERFINILEKKGLQILVLDDIYEQSSSAAVEHAVKLASGAKVNMVVALGGVRLLHIAKAVTSMLGAIASGNNISVYDWIDKHSIPDSNFPLILIPTSYRDPFLLSGGMVLSDARNGNAVFLNSQSAQGTALFIDSNVLGGLSAKTKSAVLLDGMMAAIEGYTSTKADFLSDLTLKEAVAFYVRALDDSLQHQETPQASLDASKACFLMGMGLSSAAPGLGTAISFAIHTRWGIPKSNIAAVILPYLMELLAQSRPEKIVSIAPFFCDTDSGYLEANTPERCINLAIEALRTRLGLLKIPSRLKDFDLTIDQLVDIASVVRNFGFMNFFARPLTVDEIFDFIKAVY